MLKEALKTVFGVAVWASGFGWFMRCVYARRRVTILLYHDPKPERFARHLAYLTQHYHVVSYPDMAAALAAGDTGLLPPRALVITMDDGHRGNAALGRHCAAFGVRPMLFVCSGIVATARQFWWQSDAARKLGIARLKSLPDAQRRAELAAEGWHETQEHPERSALSREELQSLRAVMDIGAHTRFHPILPQADADGARAEIAGCKADLEALLGEEVRHFAYPNGDYGPREAALVREAGYATARTTQTGFNTAATDPYRLKILPSPDDASLWWLRAQLSGLPGLLRRALGLSSRYG